MFSLNITKSVVLLLQCNNVRVLQEKKKDPKGLFCDIIKEILLQFVVGLLHTNGPPHVRM